MSQQEFAPGPQSQQPGNEDEIYKPQYPYSWSGNSDSEAAPRDEPPSTYEYDPAAMEQGYQAQDMAGQPGAQTPLQPGANPYEYQPPVQQQLPPQYQYSPNSSDGDAYEQGYSPYSSPYNSAQNNQVQGAPPWARPQPRQGGPFRFGWIILVLIIISMGSSVFRYGFFLGHFAGFIFLPILILMIIVSALSQSLWGGGRRRGGSRRRGPWGW